MVLDDIIKKRESLEGLIGIRQNLKQDFTNPANINNFLGYAMQSGEQLPAQELNIIKEEISKNPFKLRALVENSLVAEQNSFIDMVRENYANLMNSLEELSVLNVAMNIPDKNKKFYDIESKLKEGKYEAVQKAYANTFDNKVWKEFVKLADLDFIKEYATRYVQVQQQKFIENKFGYKENNKMEIDYSKVRDYVSDTIDRYSKKDDRNNAYLVLGEIYANQELTKKAGKEKSKKSKKK